jgi:hypothetical protein
MIERGTRRALDASEALPKAISSGEALKRAVRATPQHFRALLGDGRAALR